MRKKLQPRLEVENKKKENKPLSRLLVLLLLLILGLVSSCLIIFDLFYHFRPQILLEANPRTKGYVIEQIVQEPTLVSDETFLEVGVIEPEVLQEPVLPIEEETPRFEDVVVIQPPVEEKVESEDEFFFDEPKTVPDAPFFFDPLVSELSAIDSWAEFETDSEDFWDDFVFSDDAPAYFDGINYVPVYVNGEYYSNIETNIIDSVASVNREELANILYGLLTDEYYDAFFESTEPYYSIDYMLGKEAEAVFNEEKLEIYIDFNADQFPIRELSVSPSIALNVIRNNMTMEGAVDLEPAGFAAATNLSLFGALIFNDDFQLITSSLGLSGVTYLSFLDSGVDLSFSLSKSGLTLNSFRSYYDFSDQNVRLTFGHIGSSSPIFSSNAFGLSLERSYSYGEGTALSSQYAQSVVVEEASTLEVLINNVSSLKRSLNVGIYQLKDFAFVQGANEIKIVITPLSGGEPKTYTYFTGFDSSLLALGEHFWKFSVAIPQSTIDSSRPAQIKDFRMPWLNNQDLVFQVSDLLLSFEHRIGVAHDLTISDYVNASIALSSNGINRDGSVQGTFGLVWANKVGTTSLNMNTLFTSRYQTTTPIISSQFSAYLSQSFNNEILKPLSFNVNYNSSSGAYGYTSNQRLRILSANMGYSFSLTSAIHAGLAGSMSYSLSTRDFLWSASANVGGSFLTGLSLSGNFSVNNSSGAITSALSLGGSYVVGPKTNVSASTSIGGTSSIGISQKLDDNGKHNLQLNIGQIDFADILNHNLNASYSYNGSLVGAGLRFGAASNYSSYSLGLSANSAFAYADGAIGMAKNISNNFLLVKPQGILKHSDISVAKATDSSSKAIPKLFNSVVYTGLNSYSRNSVVVYGTTDSLFGSGGLFLFNIYPKARQGYVAKISITPTVTVSGVLYHADGTVYDQYSSPIYQIKFSDDNKTVEMLDMSAGYYLFTDQDGRYIVSDLPVGTYCFDLEVKQGWYGICFVVPELEQDSLVIELEPYTENPDQFSIEPKGIPHLTDYNATVMLDEVQRIDENSFWDSLFSFDDEIMETVEVGDEEFQFLE